MTNPPATLLLVDDEPSILSALRRLFRPEGHHLLLAESGAQALKLLEEQPVDLIISDMRMPEMDGAAFLKQAKAKVPGTIRILLTGYADMQATVSAINEGEIYRYIAKPWNDQDLIMLVRDALAHQALKAENQRLTELTQQQNESLKALNATLEEKVQARTAELSQALAFVEQSHSELKKSFLTTVQVFAGLIELRSASHGQQFAGHGRRVAELARSIGKQLGLNETQCQHLLLAGLVHDIGKIGLPDALLAKPFNHLQVDERAQMMKHPEIGHNLLLGIERLKEVAIIVRHHHENYDGTGFPAHLSGIAIPQEARILAVANDYDALQLGTLAMRPLQTAEALGFLIDNRGKRYDPAVVDALALILAERGKGGFIETPLRTMHLKPGMETTRDLMHRDGYLLLAKGNVLTRPIIEQLLRLEQIEQHPLTLYIRQETP